ncbi:MAG: hypothetical protein ACXVNM_10395 [Bacteroidia bacterium]
MTEFPLQTGAVEELIVMVGEGKIVTLTVCEFVHPAVFVPVTLYVVVIVGFTATGEPLRFPGFQVYVLAPMALKVAETPLPLQINVGLDDAVMVGLAFTVIVTVFEFKHPKELAPVTV